MKLSAIMLIMNSFFANQQGLDVVNKIIQPIKHISADAPLSKIEFEQEATAINAAASFCRDADLLSELDAAQEKLLAYYQDMASFDKLIIKLTDDVGVNLLDISVAIDTLLASVKTDLQLKLTEFESEVLKRGRNLQQLDDINLLRQLVNNTSRFFAEFKMLMTQASITDVAHSRSFLSDEDIELMAQQSDSYFKARSV